jgi:nicotinamidase-related amidase
MDPLVLCEVATEKGVESTARFACEYGYQQIFAEDAMSSSSEELYAAAVNGIFTRIGQVRRTNEIVKALN